MSKNKFFTLSFLFFTLFSLLTTKSVSAFTGTGSGTTESPYQITTCDQFQEISSAKDSVYILQNDIDCRSIPNWTSIGSNPGESFTGVLNGNNKKISNVSITSSSSYGTGLFGSIDAAEVKNLIIDNININVPAGNNVGGLAGLMGLNGGGVGSTISNVSASGSIIGKDYVGGLFGYVESNNNIITYLTSSININGNNFVGGLIGFDNSSINNSSTTGNITGTGDDIGGLVGEMFDSSVSINNSYTTGDITGPRYIGGLVGQFNGDSVLNSYSTGDINGGSYIGGLVGIFNGTTLSYSYTTGSVTSIDGNYIGGLVGQIKALEISDCHTIGQVESGGQDVGGLFGLFYNDSLSTITNTYTKGSVTSTYNGTDNFAYVGGLIGDFSSGNGSSLDYSYALGNVNSIKGYIGGLIGNDSSAAGNNTISFVYATGNVTSTEGDKVGGLIGWNNSSINNVFASGSVSGVNTVGGLIGGDGSLEIKNAYSSGSVSGSTLLGGLIGFIGSSTVLDSFYDSETSLQSDNVGKGVPKTTAEMKTVSTFTNWNFGSGIHVDWKLDSFGNMNNGYPFLMLSIQSIISGRNQTVSASQPVTINSLNDPSFTIWLAPASPDVLTEGPTITKAPGDSTTILAPSIPGTYYFYVSDSTDTSFYTDLDLISITVVHFSGNGSGTSESPYEITTCGQLQEISDFLDSNFILKNDIDCSGVQWTPIGIDPGTPFTGTLIGNNKTVNNITIGDNFQFNGFFGDIDNGYIKDLYINNINIGGTSSIVGGLTGTIDNGQIGTTISNVHITGSIFGNYVGGIIGQGFQSSTTVSNSSFEGNISANSFAGGILGLGICSISNSYSSGTITEINPGSGNGNMGGLIGGVVAPNGFISNSYSTININTPDSNGSVGGLVGQATSPFYILNSYAIGDVSGKSNVGGLIGLAVGTSITNTYSKGKVSDASNKGGLAGASYGSTIINSFYDSETSLQSDVDKGIPKTTSEMKTVPTFTDWDFTDIWKIDSNGIINTGYPFLKEFAIPESTPTPTPEITPTEIPIVNGSSTNIDNHSCTTPKPLSIANLFQINSAKNSAKVFFSPLADTNQYFISFSEKPNAEEHGAQMTLAREGVQNITIDKLKPNTTYYVKVRGQNGCMPGDWSNTMKFTTNSSNKIFYKGSLITGKVNSIIKSIKNTISKPNVTKETNIETPNDLKITPTITPKSNTNSEPVKSTSVPETKQKKCFLWWCW